MKSELQSANLFFIQNRVYPSVALEVYIER